MAKGKRRFVQVESDFYRHRKTLKLRRLIGDAAFWIPPRLWAYCIDRDSDDLADFDAEDLAAVLEYSGDAAALRAGLIESGFLSSDGNTVSGWHERYRVVFDRFAERARKAANARHHPPSVPEDERRGDEMIEDKIRKHEQACFPDACSMLEASESFPTGIDTSTFRATWSDWLAYRRERKLPAYKPTSLKTQLATLAEWGHDAAIASIRESIRQQWQGLFPPKQSCHPAPRQGGHPYQMPKSNHENGF